MEVWRFPHAMHESIALRALAKTHRAQALAAATPASAGVHWALAHEFDRDAELAEREEVREAYRLRADGAAELSHGLIAA